MREPERLYSSVFVLRKRKPPGLTSCISKVKSTENTIARPPGEAQLPRGFPNNLNAVNMARMLPPVACSLDGDMHRPMRLYHREFAFADDSPSLPSPTTSNSCTWLHGPWVRMDRSCFGSRFSQLR